MGLGIGLGLLSLIGTGVSTYSSISGGKAARDAAEAEAALRKAEAKERASAMRRNADQQLADMRLVVAKSGIEISGTPLDLIAQNAYELELEAADVERFGSNAARMAHERGRSYNQAGILGGVGGFISGAAVGISLIGP